MAGLGSQVEKEKVHPAMRFIVQREKIPFDQNALSISEGEKYRLSLYIKTKCVPKQHCQNQKGAHA